MRVLTAPSDIRDLTGEWLTTVLHDVSDGARVTDLIAVPIGLGNVATSVRLVPSWDRPTPAPSSLVAKVPATAPESRSTGFATRTYQLEAAFYNELAGSLWVHRPACFFAHCDPEHETYVVLLEDMSPAEPGDQVAGCSPEDAAAAMPELAALHAPLWGAEDLLALKWLDRPTAESLSATIDLVPALYSGFVDRYRERLEPDVLQLAERLMGSLESYLVDRPQPWTVVHGDFRLDNLLFGGPRVVVIDWQTVKIGAGMSDVSYFVGSALHPEDRRQHEANLVRSYYSFLTEMGVSLAWGDCWDGYRRYCFDGLLMGIVASMLVTRSSRSDDMFMAMANRHARQAIDLGSTEFLVP
jgi:hypothetical protein